MPWCALRTPRVITLLLATIVSPPFAEAQDDTPPEGRTAAHRDEAGRLIDAWLDDRDAHDARPLLRKLERLGFTSCDDMETLIRAGRIDVPEPELAVGKHHAGVPMTCDHVDYDTTYDLYLPSDYDPTATWPLVLVGHGGNSEMSQERAARTATSYLQAFIPTAERAGWIVAAPATGRGWGRIGNSLLLSCVSQLSRKYAIDPDRIYATGQSMGGHMSWRCGLSLPDRWGAIAPMSGGYDYVENQQVYRLFNVPGYATFGEQEPYQIADFNRKIRDWMSERNYPWVSVEKLGRGHEIFPDEIAKIADFFAAHPRNLYRDAIYFHVGNGVRVTEAEAKKPGWPKAHRWNPDRPIDHGIVHWARVEPQASGDARRAFIRRTSPHAIDVVATGDPTLTLYLHPSQFDLSNSLEVTANGRSKTHRVSPDPRLLLELVHEFDDRGRIFHASVEVAVKGEAEIPVPRFD